MVSKIYRVLLVAFGLSLCDRPVLYAQIEDDHSTITVSPEKGIRFQTPDGFMEFRLGLRMQQQMVLTHMLNERDALHGEYMIRRNRVLFRGFIFNGKLDYFVQLGMDRGSTRLLNAEYRWKPDSYTEISFGQFFPPTFRQFQTTSGQLQMADRSNVIRFFFTDYDLGLKVRRTVPVSEKFQFKIAGALTHGEGKNTATASGGWAHMARLEVLPFGAFTAGGDYSESDLVREKAPRLSIGGGYYQNNDAYTMYGATIWDGYQDDITDTFADVLFKYNGFSLLAEYIHRRVENEILTLPEETYFSKKISGRGWYLQSGVFLSDKIEPTLRLSMLDPNNRHQTLEGRFTRQTKIALGLNYFFLKHHLKWQSQIGYVNEEFTGADNSTYLEFLTQITLSF